MISWRLIAASRPWSVLSHEIDHVIISFDKTNNNKQPPKSHSAVLIIRLTSEHNFFRIPTENDDETVHLSIRLF